VDRISKEGSIGGAEEGQRGRTNQVDRISKEEIRNDITWEQEGKKRKKEKEKKKKYWKKILKVKRKIVINSNSLL
jgi:2-phosphoglycerate kinase